MLGEVTICADLMIPPAKYFEAVVLACTECDWCTVSDWERSDTFEGHWV